MILKGSQRGGARALADHLLNDRDNDHVTVEELRGFTSGNLRGAMAETHAIAKGTRCTQCVFSLSLNPPKDAATSVDDLRNAADRAEKALGLEGQPRALVIHEKEGRRHAHVVWSRIDAEAMKAVNLPYYKNRLKEPLQGTLPRTWLGTTGRPPRERLEESAELQPRRMAAGEAP